MGGHGGLNILPQKRWNVYNRDNRLKVARDEAAHAEQQRELDEKHKAAEAQARRKLLLERAKERRAAALGDLARHAGAGQDEDESDHQLTEAPEPHQLEQAQQLGHAATAAADATALQDSAQHEAHGQPHQQLQLQLDHKAQAQPVLEHINFWKDLECKAQHPEREKEQKEARKRRGNPDTYTTDARFDESFQLGYGLSGPKPWYARAIDPSAVTTQAAAPAAPAGVAARQHKQQLGIAGDPPRLIADGTKHHKKRKKHHHSSSSSSSSYSSISSSSSSSSSSDSDDSAGSRRRRQRAGHGRHKKSKHNHRSSSSKRKKELQRRSSSKHKRDDKHKRKSRPAVAAASSEPLDKSLALAHLRAQRLEREAAERKRALEATGQLPVASKRYNSSYGYADLLKAQHGHMPGAAFIAKGASAAAVAGLGQRFSR